MSKLFALVLCSLVLSRFSAKAAPAFSSGTSSTYSALPSSTVVPASDNPNEVLWSPDATDITPSPIRGSTGATILGPQDVELDRQNPDTLAPPSTDAGSIPNTKWPMGLSHQKLSTGGWNRQQNINQMPIAKNLAGVNMRLEAGTIRELHWHTQPEWAYVIKGSTQITAVNQLGQNYIANVGAGDLWYFPPGVGHSLQGMDGGGTEFLLVFPDGSFSAEGTFLLTDFLSHIPKSVLAKNFKTDVSAWDTIPKEQLFMFPSSPPPANRQEPVSPAGTVSQAYSYPFSQVNATMLDGGSVKIADSTVFPISKTIAVAEVTVNPGAMRELHWHPTEDEWAFFLEGNARVTLFAASGNAETHDFQAGDVGYAPAAYGHYVENIGNSTLKFLEIFNTAVYQDVSLGQWLALTPPELIQAHLGLSSETIASFNKNKPVVVAGSVSST